MKVGVIIQARLGSTRLTEKLKREFYKGKSLGEIVFGNIAVLKDHYPVIVATTTNKNDDYIEGIAKQLSLNVFRGSESNVLSRFIDCAEENEIDTIVRICSDNPLIQIDLIHQIIDSHIVKNTDYTSFFLPDNRPVIKSHYGFFAEVVSLEALKRVQRNTDDPLYQEHVTNYVYSNPEQFKINKIPTPSIIDNNPEVRLTIDTIEDFNLASELYTKLYPSLELEELFKLLLENQAYEQIMKEQIELNGK